MVDETQLLEFTFTQICKVTTFRMVLYSYVKCIIYYIRKGAYEVLQVGTRIFLSLILTIFGKKRLLNPYPTENLCLHLEAWKIMGKTQGKDTMFLVCSWISHLVTNLLLQRTMIPRSLNTILKPHYHQ